jgi:hypothetical protein
MKTHFGLPRPVLEAVGLSISKVIAEEHGGRLKVGERDGHTAVSLTLPALKNSIYPTKRCNLASLDGPILLGGGDHTLLETAEQGEDTAKKSYKEALEKELPAPVKQLLATEYEHKQKSHDYVKEATEASKSCKRCTGKLKRLSFSRLRIAWLRRIQVLEPSCLLSALGYPQSTASDPR